MKGLSINNELVIQSTSDLGPSPLLSDFNFEKMKKKGGKLIAAGKLKLGIIQFNFKHIYKYSNNRNTLVNLLTVM